jgi:hypothetical protein
MVGESRSIATAADTKSETTLLGDGDLLVISIRKQCID